MQRNPAIEMRFLRVPRGSRQRVFALSRSRGGLGRETRRTPSACRAGAKLGDYANGESDQRDTGRSSERDASTARRATRLIASSPVAHIAYRLPDRLLAARLSSRARGTGRS